MKIIDVSVRNGTLVVVCMILVVLMGFFSLTRIPIQLNPTIDRPIISVSTRYPGAAPMEVESEVTRRQEEKLAAVEDLREIRSFSREGRASINLEFDWGVNKDIASLNIMKKLNLVRNLPDEVEEWQISAVDSEERQSIVRVTVASDLPVNIVREMMEDRVGPQLERVSGVGRIQWYGGARREIQVLLDLAALDSRRVSISEVLEALQRGNQNMRGGKIEQGNSRLLVRTVGQYTNLDQIRRTIVKNSLEGPIRITDIAQVVDGFDETERVGRTDGKPSLNLGISKKSGSNSLEVVEGIKAEIARLNIELKRDGVELIINYDVSAYIWDSIYEVRNNLIIGAVLATAVLLLFLRSFSATFAIGLTIPVCSIGTFILLWLAGRSVNVISLAGLAFAGGMVLDNAIVVMENIYRHRTELAASPYRAARDAAEEVWAPIVASTLTTLAVFLPIIFIREEAGQLFRDIAYSISFAVGISMIAAITIVPMIASRLMHRIPKSAQNEGADEAANPPQSRTASPKRSLDPFRLLGSIVASIFQKTAELGIRRRLVRVGILATILAAFLSSLMVVPPAEYLPQSQSTMIFGNINMPTGMSLEAADRQVSKIEQFVAGRYANLERSFFVVGHDRSFFGLFVKRDKATNEEIDRIISEVEDHAAEVLPSDIQFSIFRRSDFGWRGEGKRIGVEVRGPDLDMLQQISERLEDRIMTMNGVKGVFSSMSRASPELQILPDRERLADLGLTAHDLARVVETMLEGTRASLYREGGKEHDLIVKAREGQILHPDKLKAVTIKAPTGDVVRLDELASIERRLGPVGIQHIEQERVISLGVSIDEDVPLQTFIQDVRANVVEPFQETLPSGYWLKLSGSADDLARTMKALSTSFLGALVIIYLLMAALFQSFLYPFVVMFSVPLAMTGAFLGVWATGSEFNVITMLGLVLLAGIVVNNAILLVDFALRRIRDGIDINQAVLDAVRIRMRPIFMTSTTTVLGMLPMTLGGGTGTELYSGLGAAVVGGMVLSTVFTLVLIPLVLVSVLELRGWILTRLGRDPMADVAHRRRLAELEG